MLASGLVHLEIVQLLPRDWCNDTTRHADGEMAGTQQAEVGLLAAAQFHPMEDGKAYKSGVIIPDIIGHARFFFSFSGKSQGLIGRLGGWNYTSGRYHPR